MMIEFEVYNFHIYGKGVPFRSLLETLVLYKVGPQVMLLSFPLHVIYSMFVFMGLGELNKFDFKLIYILKHNLCMVLVYDPIYVVKLYIWKSSPKSLNISSIVIP
jgi:hypothetical protein